MLLCPRRAALALVTRHEQPACRDGSVPRLAERLPSRFQVHAADVIAASARPSIPRIQRRDGAAEFVMQRHSDLQPGVIVLGVDIGHEAARLTHVDTDRGLICHERVVIGRRRDHATSTVPAVRYARQPGLGGHGLEHPQRLLDTGLGDGRQVTRAHGIEPAEQIHPLVGLVRLWVDMVGDELLALTQHLQPVPGTVRVLEPGTGGLGPAFGFRPVYEQNPGRSADALTRRAEVLLAPGDEARGQVPVDGIHIQSDDGLCSLSAQHANPVVRVAEEVSDAEARMRPVGQCRALRRRLDRDDQIAIGQQSTSVVPEIRWHWRSLPDRMLVYYPAYGTCARRATRTHHPPWCTRSDRRCADVPA